MKTFLLSLAVAVPLAASAADAPEPKTYSTVRVQRVVVQTDGGPINLTATGAQTVSVEVSPPAGPGDECSVSQDVRDGTLTLTARAASRHLFGGGKPCSAGFSVEAPALIEFSARSGSGRVDFGAFSGNADLRTGSGDIVLHGALGALSLRSGSGRIAGEASGRTIDVQNGSGNVHLLDLSGWVKARTGSGSVALEWTSAPRAGDIDVRTGSGDLSATLPADTKLKFSMKSGSGTIGGDFTSDEKAPLRLTFRSGSGGARLTKGQ